MGLLDSVIGGTPSESGLSAATKALLLVLAAKAAKDYLGRRQAATQPAAPVNAPPAGGGLGSILGGLLGGANPMGGLPGGLGSILNGGGPGGLGGLLGGLGGAGVLGALVNQFTRNGHGEAMNSWIGVGPNHTLPPEQLGEALGEEPLQELQASTGLPRQTLLAQLAQELPEAIDHVTPDGRLPTEEELASSLKV